MIQIGDDLANQRDTDALAAQRAHLRRRFACGGRQIILGRSTLDAAGDDLGAAGKEAEHIDILQDADKALAVVNSDAPLIELGHEHKS